MEDPYIDQRTQNNFRERFLEETMIPMSIFKRDKNINPFNYATSLR